MLLTVYFTRRTEGFSGADLENLVREAVLHLLTTVRQSQVPIHGLINYIDTKAKCRHLEKLTS
jgi:hypothetical protein